MDNELRYPLTDLTAGSMLRLDDVQGRAIVVFEGRVWITQEGDLRDVVVDGGQSFSVDRQGLTLVQALHPSKLMVLDAGAHGAWGADIPNSAALHQWARQQRSEAIARGLAKAMAALRRLLAPAAPRTTQRPAMPALRVCTAVR